MRQSTGDATDRKRARDVVAAMDVSGDSPAVKEKLPRVDAPHLTFVVNKEVVTEHAQWRDPRMTDRWCGVESPPLQATDAVISERIIPTR